MITVQHKTFGDLSGISNLVSLETSYHLQEKQLKKIRAKQRRLQAILGVEEIQPELEVLTEDEGKIEIQFHGYSWP